jgi:peptidyl-prolyl cis-trans isomerase B (cyclophilin B)
MNKPLEVLLAKGALLAALLSVAGIVVPPSPAQIKDPIVVLRTVKGPIFIRVFANEVPYTARNFLDLVNRGFYNGLTFHRIEQWCIQGGDPNGNGTGDFIDPQTGQPRYIRLEINSQLHHNGPGIVAMARTQSPDSASCQFYITKSQTRFLDGKYAIFGTVVKGIEVVYNIVRGDRIESAEIYQPNAAQQQNNVPQAQPVGDSGF